jgi:hypothetical protein
LCQYTASHTYGTFSDTAAFSQYAAKQGVSATAPDLSGMLFDSAPPTGGLPATRLDLYYSYYNQLAWDYDSAARAYRRSQDNADAVLAPMPDRLTGETLAFENVVVLFADHVFESPTIIEINLWSQTDGRALALRDGQARWVRWASPSTDTPLQLTLETGEPYPFRPGATWWEIVGQPSTAEQAGTGEWKVRFYP